MAEARECPRCHETKPLSEFPKKGKTRKGQQRYSYCKPCHSEYQRENKLKLQFGLTVEEYDAILEYQQGLCAICDREPKEGGLRLSVDHDHKTGLIRGLVCWKCNKAIGLLNDSPDAARALAKHLERPIAIEALGKKVYGRTGRTTNKHRRLRTRA